MLYIRAITVYACTELLDSVSSAAKQMQPKTASAQKRPIVASTLANACSGTVAVCSSNAANDDNAALSAYLCNAKRRDGKHRNRIRRSSNSNTSRPCIVPAATNSMYNIMFYNQSHTITNKYRHSTLSTNTRKCTRVLLFHKKIKKNQKTC